MILKITYTCADYPLTYFRYYLKIQNIFSQIGGYIDFLFIIFNFITMYFSKKNLIVDITDNLICHSCINDYTKNLKRISIFINNNNENSNKDVLFNSSLHRHSLIFNNVQYYNLNLNTKNSLIHNFSILNDNNLKNRIKNRKIPNSNIKNYNLKLTKFLKEKNNNPYQDLKINYFDYIIPFFCLRKYKKYDLLCTYSDIMYSYLSLEEMLPSIEKISKLFKEKK